MTSDDSNNAEAAPRTASDHFSLTSVAATAAVWLSLAALVFLLRRTSASELFDGPVSIGTQSIIGIAVGTASGVFQFLLLRTWPRWREFTRRAVSGLRLTPARAVLISLMVAPTEELFFRAALQPLVGFWAATALFTLAHLRINREAFTRGHRLTTIVTVGMLFGMGALLGVVFAHAGLAAAIGAHFVYDVIVLSVYRSLLKGRSVPPWRIDEENDVSQL